MKCSNPNVEGFIAEVSFIREYVGNQKEKKINKNMGGKHKKEV
jgi:hypothetical protein